MDYVVSLKAITECLEDLEIKMKTEAKAPDSCFYIRAALSSLAKVILSLPKELEDYNRGTIPSKVDKLYGKATRSLVALKEALLEKLKDEKTPSIVCLVEALSTLEESNEALIHDLKAHEEESQQNSFSFPSPSNTEGS